MTVDVMQRALETAEVSDGALWLAEDTTMIAALSRSVHDDLLPRRPRRTLRRRVAAYASYAGARGRSYR